MLGLFSIDPCHRARAIKRWIIVFSSLVILAMWGIVVETIIGARDRGGVIDGWLVDVVDEAAVDKLESDGVRCRAVPLWMTDVDTTKAIAQEALDLASEIRA